MKNHIPSVSVGIPAHNESATIRHVIDMFLKQKQQRYLLREIIVVSDGSTDDTIIEIKKNKSKKVRLIEKNKRMGKAAAINTLLKKFTGDILILVDADITITDIFLLEKMISTTNFKKAGLVTVDAMPTAPQNYFEKTIYLSTLITRSVRQKWNNGNNYLSFKGCFLALHKDLAKNISLTQSLINDDAFIYFSTVEKGYTPQFLSSLHVYYSLPSTFSDHLKQSERFQYSKKELEGLMSISLEKFYCFPKTIFLKEVMKFLVTHPIVSISYIVINIRTKIYKSTKLNATWEYALSTKKRYG